MSVGLTELFSLRCLSLSILFLINTSVKVISLCSFFWDKWSFVCKSDCLSLCSPTSPIISFFAYPTIPCFSDRRCHVPSSWHHAFLSPVPYFLYLHHLMGFERLNFNILQYILEVFSELLPNSHSVVLPTRDLLYYCVFIIYWTWGLTMEPWLTWISRDISDWPWTHRVPLISASWD